MNDVSDTEMFAEFEKADMQEVRKLARLHTRDAIKTLVKLMKAPKTPPGVKRACAADILAQGWGRPDARGDSNAGQGGITINVLKLATGVVEQIVTNTPESKSLKGVDISEAIKLGSGLVK